MTHPGDAFDYSELSEIGSLGLGRITMLSSIKKHTQLDFRDTMIFIAEAFGFKHDPTDERPVPRCWVDFRVWQDAHQIRMGHIQGPHAFALFKTLAAQRNVSTGQ